MIRTALLALATLAALPAAAQVVVKGDWVTLADVTPVTGDAGKTIVGAAPPAGQQLALDPAFLVSLAKKSGVILAIPLDEPVLVTRGTAPAAPKAPVALVARSAPHAPQPPMAVSETPPEGWVLVVVRDVGRGAVLGESDLRWADPESVRDVRMPPELDGALGMEAKRMLKAGTPLTMTDLKAPSLVRKGEPVKIVYSSPGMKLTVDGLAQADAAKGESVRVLNSLSKRTIEAVATAEGEASVLRR